MTAQEAKTRAIWNSLPDFVKSRINTAVSRGEIETFIEIDKSTSEIRKKLNDLGYYISFSATDESDRIYWG